MRKLFLIISVICLFSSKLLAEDPQTVKEINVARYMGLWYEIAHYPNFFQGDCLRSTAEYGILESGRVSVFNTCYKESGKISTIKGEAFIANASEPGKLKVDFNFPFLGDYWIIDLDENYQWAVVSGPNKKSLFILSRTVPMDDLLLKKIVANLDARGFDISRIIFDVY